MNRLLCTCVCQLNNKTSKTKTNKQTTATTTKRTCSEFVMVELSLHLPFTTRHLLFICVLRAAIRHELSPFQTASLL